MDRGHETRRADVFRDRTDAGRTLATRLGHLRDVDAVVVGLPRGGVPVAYEVASAIGAPLDVIVVRKIGVPGNPEFAMGAVGEDGARVVDDGIVRLVGVSTAAFARAESRARAELDERIDTFRQGRRAITLAGRTVAVVDDGMATGASAKAACQVVAERGAARIVLAVPVTSAEAVVELSGLVDEVVCVSTPWPFEAVGQWYADFTQTTDEEVSMLLAAYRPGTHDDRSGSP